MAQQIDVEVIVQTQVVELAVQSQAIDIALTGVAGPPGPTGPAGSGGGAVSSVAGRIGDVVLTTADVADSLDKRYVTDAQRTIIGNTSGTNTGDQTSVSGNAGTATKLAASKNIDGQAFDGSADITVIAPGTHAATSKTTPVDADELPLVDSAASNLLKKLTWANLKATLKTYFDGIYQAVGAYITASSSDTLTNKTIDTDSGNVLKLRGQTLTAATANTGTYSFPGTSGTTTIATVTNTQTLSNKTLTAPIIATINNGGTLTLPTGPDTLVGRATTDTLTNKRVTPRTGTVASSATPTINTDNVDFYSITALAADITSFTTNLTGTPTDGQTLWIAITDNGTARAIAWGTSFEASTIPLPTTTVISTRLDVGFVWNVATTKWRCVAVS